MKLFNIGLYVRVSTEEQAENPEGSIKNQEARLREYVKLKQMVSPFGEIKEVFIDAGISAKDMNRPALQGLLNKIRSRDIDMILVTELSRFTRSIRDFSILKEFLEKHQCKFLSIKDNFDTSTAAGELVMYMMANIAEFERKQTAERISHSFLARAKRGLYNGGSVPLGYEIDKEKQGHLVIHEEEAEIVKMIFATFLKEETLVKTAKYLNDKGMTLPRRMRGSGGTRASFFRMDQVRKTLRNKAYVGIRVFSDKEGDKYEVPAVWLPIIDEVTFERVQKLLSSNRYHKRTHLNQRYPYTLSGFAYCAACGDRMAGKSAHGRNGKFPYYEHSWAIKNQASLSKRLLKCEPQRVPAAKFESAVWQEVKIFLLSPEVTQALLDAAKRLIPENKAVAEITRLKRKSQAIALQIETLTERISRLPKGMNEKPFFDQMMKLQDTQKLIEVQMIELKNQLKPDDVIDLEDLMKFTASLKVLIKKADNKPEIQAEILRKLVHRVEIRKNGCEVHLHVGKRYYRQEFDDKELNPSERPHTRTPYLPKFLKNNGSKRLTNGGATMARTRQRRATAEPGWRANAV
jgi:DNA invertase Pin-like site-specific DNA recombinase